MRYAAGMMKALDALVSSMSMDALAGGFVALVEFAVGADGGVIKSKSSSSINDVVAAAGAVADVMLAASVCLSFSCATRLFSATVSLLLLAEAGIVGAAVLVVDEPWSRMALAMTSTALVGTGLDIVGDDECSGECW